MRPCFSAPGTSLLLTHLVVGIFPTCDITLFMHKTVHNEHVELVDSIPLVTAKQTYSEEE